MRKLAQCTYYMYMTLKVNSKKILDVAVSKPEMNQTEAYKAVHVNASDVTARTNAYKLFKKPEAQIYLQQHIEKAKNKIVSLVDSDKEEIALRAADSLLDRSLGKATQRTEVTTTGITLTIDLTSSLEDA